MYDSLYENDKATATVTVQVTRNPSTPRFTDNLPTPFTYTRLITESFPVGDVVIDVNATDDDGVCRNSSRIL